MQSLAKKTRVVVVASGGGRSFANLLSVEKTEGSWEICGLLVSRPDCPAKNIARQSKVPIFCDNFRGEDEPSEELSRWIHSLNVDIIVLAGFLKKFPCQFPKKSFSGKIINIHPALLPDFGGRGMYGANVHNAVVAAKAPCSGASVHFVDEDYDRGPVIAQASVSLEGHESAEDVAKRVFEIECKLLPDTLTELSNGTLPLRNGNLKRFEYKIQ